MVVSDIDFHRVVGNDRHWIKELPDFLRVRHFGKESVCACPFLLYRPIKALPCRRMNCYGEPARGPDFTPRREIVRSAAQRRLWLSVYYTCKGRTETLSAIVRAVIHAPVPWTCRERDWFKVAVTVALSSSFGCFLFFWYSFDYQWRNSYSLDSIVEMPSVGFIT